MGRSRGRAASRGASCPRRRRRPSRRGGRVSVHAIEGGGGGGGCSPEVTHLRFPHAAAAAAAGSDMPLPSHPSPPVQWVVPRTGTSRRQQLRWTTRAHSTSLRARPPSRRATRLASMREGGGWLFVGKHCAPLSGLLATVPCAPRIQYCSCYWGYDVMEEVESNMTVSGVYALSQFAALSACLPLFLACRPSAQGATLSTP